MDGQGSVQIHAKPVDLTGALMAHPDTRSRLSAEVMARGPKRGGLNIEGLAMHPSGGVMLGLRSPLGSEDGMRGPALLVHLAPVRAAGASELEVREVLAVDLADRGVRSLARDGEGWLALAGPVGREGGFDLYRIGSDGRVLRVDGGEALDGLNPEALVQDAGRWWVISDDGKVDRPDPTAGDGARGCDKIRKKTAEGSAHASVYARRFDLGPLAMD